MTQPDLATYPRIDLIFTRPGAQADEHSDDYTYTVHDATWVDNPGQDLPSQRADTTIRLNPARIRWDKNTACRTAESEDDKERILETLRTMRITGGSILSQDSLIRGLEDAHNELMTEGMRMSDVPVYVTMVYDDDKGCLFSELLMKALIGNYQVEEYTRMTSCQMHHVMLHLVCLLTKEISSTRSMPNALVSLS